MNKKYENFLQNLEGDNAAWMYACSRCGECVDECPVYQQTSNKYEAPGFKIKKMRPIINRRRIPLLPAQSEGEIEKIANGLYNCTLCGRCVSVCPYQYDLVDLWESARESAVKSGLEPEPIKQLVKTTLTEKNYLSRPHAQRKNWARGLAVPEKTSAETLYFAGCVISYTPSLKAAAMGVSKILNAANEDWAMLGDEWCCGVPLKFGGETEKLAEFAGHNVDAIEASGAKKIVFSCPGCYRMFKQTYPKVLGRPLKFSTLHIIELVEDYVKAGKLGLNGKLEEKLTYHDPCELARLLGVVEQPRNVLRSLSTAYMELPENKLNTHCCGGGGLYKAMNIDNSKEIALRRVRQTEIIGSASLISACPSCFANLTQAARSVKSSIKVVDFADLVAQNLKEEKAAQQVSARSGI